MIRIVVFSLIAVVIIAVAVLGVAGRKSPDPPFQPFMDMVDQPRYDPQSESGFFADGVRNGRHRSTRWLGAADSRACRRGLRCSRTMNLFRPGQDASGQSIARLAASRPEELYGIFCTVCHGGTGAGNGITTQYGMNAPPSYHSDRFRQLGDGADIPDHHAGKGTDGTLRRPHPAARSLGDRGLRPGSAAGPQGHTAEDVPRHIDSRRRRAEGDPRQ